MDTTPPSFPTSRHSPNFLLYLFPSQYTDTPSSLFLLLSPSLTFFSAVSFSFPFLPCHSFIFSRSLTSVAQIVAIDLVEDEGYFAQRSAFLRHIKNVRDVINDCCIFLAVEANIGGHVATQHHEWIVAEHMEANTIMLKEATQRGNPGVWTDEDLKSSMTDEFAVALRDNRVLVFAGATGRNPDRDLGELRAQLERFTRYPKKSHVPGARTKCKVSGKGPTNSLNDDGAMALLIAYAMYKTVTSPMGCVKYNTPSLPVPSGLPTSVRARAIVSANNNNNNASAGH